MKTQKIGLVLDPYGEKFVAGLGRSIESLVKSIIQNYDGDFELYIYLKRPEVALKDEVLKSKKLIKIKSKSVFLSLDFLFGPKMDAYIFFTPVIPLFLNPQNSIVVVHDLGHLHKTCRDLKDKIVFWMQKISLIKAKKIIAVSKYTKSEIEKFFPRQSHKVSVVYNGFNKMSEFDQKELVCDLDFSRPYFLFVGVFKDRKNPIYLIKEFEEFVEKTGLDYKLVLVGKDSGAYANKVKDLIYQSKHKDKIICTGYIDDIKLEVVYKNAEALIFPSKLEGFGMPVLEAMSMSVPVILSNLEVFKEIADNAAIFFDINKKGSLVDTLIKYCSNKKLRSDMICRGLKNCAKFSWEKAGGQYIDLVKQTLNEK